MPRVPPEPISAYSFKSVADDMNELVKHLGISKAILLGHDWGGFASYRTYLYHPETFTHIITVCAFFLPIMSEYHPLEAMVQRSPSSTFVTLLRW